MIRLSKSILGDKEADAVKRVLLDDGYLGMGKEVGLFETELASYLGVVPDNVIAVNSGTAALHLATEAVIEPGDEVIVQSLTFAASFQAIIAAGGKPVPCEINADDGSLSLTHAETLLTERTKAIMPVHYASYPGPVESYYDFAKKNNLRIIEDAAHSLGCTHKGKKIGSFGDISCFSFDGIKNITCGEGGAVVTSDKIVQEKIKNARLLGIHKDTEKRLSGKRSWDFDISSKGYRYHMSNINAAIGRVQLKRLDSEFGPKRKMLAKLYREKLSGRNDIIFFETNSETIPHILPIRILSGKKNKAQVALIENGIESGIHYKPAHLLTLFSHPDINLKKTEQIYSELLSMPLHPEVTVDQIEFICQILIKSLNEI